MTDFWINGHKLAAASQQEGGEHFAADASQSNYILLQCTAPLSVEQHTIVREYHVDILEYVSINTYLCRYEPKDLDAIRALPFVVFANVYHQDLGISSGLSNIRDAASTASGSTEEGAVSETENLGTEFKTTAASKQAQEPIKVAITLHPYSKRSPSEIKIDLKTLLYMKSEAVELDGSILYLSLRPEDLSKIARIDEVRSIEEVRPLVNHCLRIQRDINIPSSMRGVAANVLDGTGELVAIYEEDGFDRGKRDPDARPPIPIHPAFHWDRVLFDNFQRIPNDYSDHHGHGTLVAGCVAANGRVGFAGIFGRNARGTAPNATILYQANRNNPQFGIMFNKALNRVNPPTHPGGGAAYIYNCSTGTEDLHPGPGPGALTYDNICTTVDTYLDTTSRELLVVWSAGNDGRTPLAKIGGAQSAKNILTVGAVESSYPIHLGGPLGDRPMVGGNIRGSPNNMANFSSPGPANGNSGGVRIKPDVVAPGIVLSCRSTEPGDLQYWAVPNTNPTDYDYAKFGVSPAPARWLYAAGTSFAAPFVSGVAAVLRKAIIRYRLFPPTSALLKAVIIHGAQDLRASGAAVPGSNGGWAPNEYQGWGRVNEERSLKVIINHENCFMLNSGPGLLQGGVATRTITIPAGRTATFAATMVFTERQSDMVQSSLLLYADDPVLGAAGRRYANWNPNGQRLNAPDPFNNVQKLVWPGLVGPANIVFTVEAWGITPPGGLGQNYSLVYEMVFT
jgi:serine protease AprX